MKIKKIKVIDPKLIRSPYCPLCGAKVGYGNYDPIYGCGECADISELEK